MTGKEWMEKQEAKWMERQKERLEEQEAYMAEVWESEQINDAALEREQIRKEEWMQKQAEKAAE